MSLERFAEVINAVEIYVRFDKIRWANLHNEKIDPVTEFINRYVYVQALKNLKVSMSELSNLLSMSENALRKKIKDLEYQGLLQLVTDPSDKRRTLLYPTQAAKWIFESDAVRRAKTFFDESERVRRVFEGGAYNLFKQHNMHEYPSYKPSNEALHFHEQTKYGYKDSDIFKEWLEHNKLPANNYPK